MVRAAALLVVLAAACGRDPASQHVVAALTSDPRAVPLHRGDSLRPASSSPVVQLAAGTTHACALHADGTTSCWGNNAAGQVADHASAHPTAPLSGLVAGIALPAAGPLDGVLEIATGVNRTCVRRAGGVWCWGSPVGPPEQVATLTDAVEITGECARTAAGEVWCWNDELAAGREPRLEPAIDLASSAGGTCSLAATGEVRCIGPDSRDLYHPYAQRVPGAVELAMGSRDLCVRMDRGGVRCWRSEETYDGHDEFEPHAVGGVADAVEVVVGTYFACARSRDRAVRCWGQLPGTPSYRVRATLVAGVSADEIAVGDMFACAGAGGDVWCWGDNDYGQLGTGWARIHAAPVTVPGIDDAVAVHAASGFSCARRGTGQVWCWGRFGVGTSDPTPRDVPEARDAVELAGASGLCARFADGAARCGYRHYLGDLIAHDAISIAASATHIVAVTRGGGLRSSGSNDYGALGASDDDQAYTSDVVVAEDVNDAIAASAGELTTCFVRRGGTVACIGRRFVDYGPGITPMTVSGVEGATAVEVGRGFACARLADATVRCWGDGTFGQLGRVGFESSLFAVSVDGLTDVVQLSGAAETMCARRRDRTVACWGSNATGVIAEPWELAIAERPVDLALTDVVDLSVSDGHACAALGSGAVVCWGSASVGQLGGLDPLDELTPARVVFPPLR